MSRSSLLSFVLVTSMLSACGSSSQPSQTGEATTGGATDPGMNAGDTGNTVTCDNDAQVVAYKPNLQVAGDANNFIFVLQKSDPGLAQKELLTWTLQVLDANTKQPVSGATVQMKKPQMPSMGHGSSQQPQIAANGSTYTISNIYLMMGGLWSFTVTATANNVSDSAVFYFCVQ